MDLFVRGCLKENVTSIRTSYKLQSREGIRVSKVYDKSKQNTPQIINNTVLVSRQLYKNKHKRNEDKEACLQRSNYTTLQDQKKNVCHSVLLCRRLACVWQVRHIPTQWPAAGASTPFS